MIWSNPKAQGMSVSQSPMTTTQRISFVANIKFGGEFRKESLGAKVHLSHELPVPIFLHQYGIRTEKLLYSRAI